MRESVSLGPDCFAYSSRRVLVTGGAGFLGSHVCDLLVERGLSVICLDNLSSGSLNNIAHLLDRPNFQFLRADVCTPISLPIAQAYNLACVASPLLYQNDPIQTVKTCVLGAMNVLALCCQFGARMLQASTSEVYGDPEVHPQLEDYCGRVNITGPRACYDEGKRCAETLCFDYCRRYDADVRVARIFNTYGPRMASLDGRVIPTFIRRALMNEPLSIFGSGEQTRSFCYVDDLVDALVRMMEAPAQCAAPMNIGNPAETTIRHLAEEIVEITNSRSVIQNVAAVVDDPHRRCPSISRASARLGWEPKTPLREGLMKTISATESELRHVPAHSVDSPSMDFYLRGLQVDGRLAKTHLAYR